MDSRFFAFKSAFSCATRSCVPECNCQLDGKGEKGTKWLASKVRQLAAGRFLLNIFSILPINAICSVSSLLFGIIFKMQASIRMSTHIFLQCHLSLNSHMHFAHKHFHRLKSAGCDIFPISGGRNEKSNYCVDFKFCGCKHSAHRIGNAISIFALTKETHSYTERMSQHVQTIQWTFCASILWIPWLWCNRLNCILKFNNNGSMFKRHRYT